MLREARAGSLLAQREVWRMLKRLDKLKRIYRDAFKDEDNQALMAAGYEGSLNEGLDLGPTFDPEETNQHRYMFAIVETDWSIIPTVDYYGFEHEDAVSGFVAEYEAQALNAFGWGGLPCDLTLCVEKDKKSLCFQARARRGGLGLTVETSGGEGGGRAPHALARTHARPIRLSPCC